MGVDPLIDAFTPLVDTFVKRRDIRVIQRFDLPGSYLQGVLRLKKCAR